MDKEQQKEWTEAQSIAVSVDLIEAAKKQLKFLAVVDQNRYLYEDHALQWAIYRYNAFWLPLLAKHLENPLSEEPLVVPLDCEWIWHCHRLNPIRYKFDCQKLYGRVLDNNNVISSIHATSKSKTEEIWTKMYPGEPYELDFNRNFSKDVLKRDPRNDRFTSYDLVSAVKRQISFTFQVSRPHMSDDLFLQEAEARYKGFLHLIRTNLKMGVNRFCVPTYDVDLMWHTHQLHPTSYCKDLIKIIGRVLQHDDTDSDRTKGNKLDTGFSETTKQWEETFGQRYWKAGAMYRGSTPSPVTDVPSEFKYEGKEINVMENCDNPIAFSPRKIMEVFLEFMEIKNLPEGYKENIRVSFSKKQPDKFFDIKRSVSILSESTEKQVAYFQCEPTGEFLFELKSHSPSDKLIPKSTKVLGSCSLSLQELLSSRTQLMADKWLSIDPVSGLNISEPILLHVSVSFTPPTPAFQVFHLESSQDSQSFFKSSRSLPLVKMEKVEDARTQTCVRDDDGNVVLSLQIRNVVKDATKCTPESLKEVHYITNSGKNRKVAESLEDNWVIKGMHGSFKLQNNSEKDGHLFELIGNKMVKLYPGRKLEFEPRHCGNHRCEQDFITAVEFSADCPYGMAVALLDLKLGTVKAVDEWIAVPGITLGFILPEILKRDGYGDFTPQCDGLMQDEVVQSGTCKVVCGTGCEEGSADCDDYSLSAEVVNSASCGGGGCKGGKCGGGKCGGKCGALESASCGGGGCKGGNCGGGKCGGKCGTLESASCGGGGCKGGNCGGGKCGGKCGALESASCGGGGCKGGNCGGGKCGGKCGALESASCGGGGCKGGKCGGKCGASVESILSGDIFSCEDMVKSSSCGGGGNCGGGKCGGGIDMMAAANVVMSGGYISGAKCAGGRPGGGICSGKCSSLDMVAAA